MTDIHEAVRADLRKRPASAACTETMAGRGRYPETPSIAYPRRSLLADTEQSDPTGLGAAGAAAGQAYSDEHAIAPSAAGAPPLRRWPGHTALLMCTLRNIVDVIRTVNAPAAAAPPSKVGSRLARSSPAVRAVGSIS